MCSAQVTAPDPAAGLTSAPSWHIAAVKALPDYRLDVRFADGTCGEIDMAGLIERADAGVFASLRELTRFQAVCVEHGAVTWPDEVDLAPDALYADIKKSGRCVLR
jgi:hypothetical protein